MWQKGTVLNNKGSKLYKRFFKKSHFPEGSGELYVSKAVFLKFWNNQNLSLIVMPQNIQKSNKLEAEESISNNIPYHAVLQLYRTDKTCNICVYDNYFDIWN